MTTTATPDAGPDRTAPSLARLREAVALSRTIAGITLQLASTLMGQLEQLSAKIDELEAAITADDAADQAFIDHQDETIADLKAQLAANQPADLQPLIDRLEAAKALIKPNVSKADAPADPQIPSGETAVDVLPGQPVES